MLGGMFGNTFNVGVPVLVFFYGPDAPRYAVFNDMLMSVPLIWSLGVWICTRLGSHRKETDQPSVWRIMVSMPPLWAFVLGVAYQQLGIQYPADHHRDELHRAGDHPDHPVRARHDHSLARPHPAARDPGGVGGEAARGCRCSPGPWRQALFAPLDEAQYAAVIEASTPAFVTLLVLASRFHLDSASAALLIGWSTILFWITLPLLMAAGSCVR